MALPNEKLILVIRTALYALIFVLGMFIFSPIALQMNGHDGLCVLYGDTNTINGYGEKTTCNYCIAIAVLFCFLYGGTMTVIGVLTLLEKIRRPENFHGILFIINVVMDALSFILVLIAACILSVGFKVLCDNLKDSVKGGHSCSDIYLIIPTSGDHDFFYNNLSIAEGGAWTCFIVWIVQTAIGVFILWRNNMLPFIKNNTTETTSSTPTTDKY